MAKLDWNQEQFPMVCEEFHENQHQKCPNVVADLEDPLHMSDMHKISIALRRSAGTPLWRDRTQKPQSLPIRAKKREASTADISGRGPKKTIWPTYIGHLKPILDFWSGRCRWKPILLANPCRIHSTHHRQHVPWKCNVCICHQITR